MMPQLPQEFPNPNIPELTPAIPEGPTLPGEPPGVLPPEIHPPSTEPRPEVTPPEPEPGQGGEQPSHAQE